MVVEIDGVLKLVPVPTALPPLEELNQLMVPPLLEADKLTEPEPQMDPSLVPRMTGAFVILMVTTLEKTEGHAPLVTIARK